MFNIFGSNNTAKEIIDNMPKFAWRVGPSFYIDEKEYTVGELVDYIKNLLKENKDLNDILKSIEEDGTKEHNNAIELRQENAKLKKDFEDQKQLKDSLQRVNEKYIKKIIKQQYSISELTKEVRDLRHLKKENVELMERVNEIDSDMNKEYQDEIFTLKNEIAVLKNRNTELQEKYNGMVNDGGLKYMEAKLQIIQNNYKKCSEERDEYKHQLNAANKEIEILKKDIVDYVFDKDEEINELKKTQDWKETVETLKNMKTQGFEDYDPSDFEVKVEKYYVCNHCGYKLAHDTNYWGGCGFCKEGLMIEKEVEEVVDTLKNMKTQGFEDYDPSDFVKTEIQIAEEEILKRELKRINDLQE